jgi:hypothetical protein
MENFQKTQPGRYFFKALDPSLFFFCCDFAVGADLLHFFGIVGPLDKEITAFDGSDTERIDVSRCRFFAPDLFGYSKTLRTDARLSRVRCGLAVSFISDFSPAS